MSRNTVFSALVITLTLGVVGVASAKPLDVSVTFTVSGGPGSYQYDFTVRNDSDDPIDVYSLSINEPGLSVSGSPDGWGQAFFSPVQWCTNADCFDTTGGIAPGGRLGGFTATAVSPEALTEVSWTMAITGPTVASFDLPNTSGDTAAYSGTGFALGATGKRRLEIIVPPGAGYTQAFGLNDSGQIVGGSTDDAAGFSFLYDLDDCTYTILDTAVAPLEINNAGVIVGNIDGLCAIRDEFGTETLITPPFAHTTCQARGINSSGDVSGFTIDDGGLWTGFIYDAQTAMFEQFLPSLQTFASGLRDNGDVVGSVFLLEDEAFPGSTAGRYGYLRSADGSIRFFEVAQAVTAGTRARGVSESGLVAGWFVDAETLDIKSFVTELSPGNAFEEITLGEGEIIFQSPCNPNVPLPPSPDYTLTTRVFASQVRDDGVVVGSCEDLYFNEVTQDSVAYGFGYVSTPVIFDTDGDGVLDIEDNCSTVANPDQRDTNGDGFGNLCDPDLNNDGIVNVVDLGQLRAVFFTNDADADFNGDGIVNVVDLGVLRAFFFGPPGPGGV